MSEKKEKGASADYEVGYRRPPVHTRFRKGHSGNPRGRGARGKTLLEAIDQAMRRKVVVTENGARKKVPRIEVAARMVANKAAAGDLAVIRFIAQHCREVNEEVGPTIRLIVSDDDMRL